MDNQEFDLYDNFIDDCLYGDTIDYAAIFEEAVLAQNFLFWGKLNEGSGVTMLDSTTPAYNGSYSGVAWDGTLSPLGELALEFDGLLSIGTLTNATFLTLANLDEGTMICFIKARNAGVWSDGATRRFMYFERNSTNRVILGKTTVVNQVSAARVAGGANQTTNYTLPSATTDWLAAAVTWSVSGNALKLFVGNALRDTQSGLLAAGVAPVRLTIGANNGPLNVHDGYECNVLFGNTALADATVIDIMQKGNP